MRAYFGHHKCGSTWIWQLVHGVCREIGLRHYLVLDQRAPSGRGPLQGIRFDPRRTDDGFERERLRDRADEAEADIVSCITSDRRQAAALAPERAFHVIRDPRDIIVSGYFSHRNSHPTSGLPELAAHRERLQEATKEEGLILEMDFSRSSLLDMAEWDYARPEVLELRMEELASAPYDGFVRIFRHLELLSEDEPALGGEILRVTAKRILNRLSWHRGLRALRRPTAATGGILLGAVYGNRFEAKTKGRPAGTEDTGSHYRKGVAGDWVNHFTPEVGAAFDERFDGLLEQLGYPALEVRETVS
jgi:Sulfotransferase domain